MPKAFLFTNKRYDLYNLNIPQPWRKYFGEGDEDPEEPSGDVEKQLRDGGYGCKRGDGEDSGELDPEIPKTFYNKPATTTWNSRDCEDEPVNLSLKKKVNVDCLDLFNLRQLAEVSISIAPDSTSNSFQKEEDDDEDTEDIQDIREVNETCVNSPNPGSSDSSDHCIVESSTSSRSSTNGSNRDNNNIIVDSNNVSSSQHKCIECGKGYSTLSNLLRHRQTHRSPSDSNAVKTCPYCDKVYVSMPAFSMHLRTHNQGCKCPYCGKLFSRPWLLQGHIRTHTGEKPFECPSCKKKFADKSNLRAHTQTHSTDKPFVCSRCNKRFGLKSYLSKHIESSCMKTARNLPSSSQQEGSNKVTKWSKKSNVGFGNKYCKNVDLHLHSSGSCSSSSSPPSSN